MDLTHVTGNCIIGNDVFISALVSTVNDNKMGKEGYDEPSIIGPTLGNGVRVGAGAILLPGVRIGAGAIVGAGAVVTKDVPPRKVVMGIPARVVRDVES
jgi:acetyltransferase-like isoleucine patch superfamily enzyme